MEPFDINLIPDNGRWIHQKHSQQGIYHLQIEY